MNYDTYYIPANFTDAGKVMGVFAVRNLVETLVLTLPVLYLCIALITLPLTYKIVVIMVIVVPLGGFALVGVNDDSLTRWFSSWWRWRRARRKITYRGEASTK